MAWNGTVTCSYCNQTGHNRRSCPTLRERVARLREEQPDHWLVRQEDSRKVRTNRKGEKRRCAWCDEMGHNRRSCPKLKGFIARFIKADLLFRSFLNREFAALGIGPGALIEETRYAGVYRYLVMAGEVKMASITLETVEAGAPKLSLNPHGSAFLTMPVLAVGQGTRTFACIPDLSPEGDDTAFSRLVVSRSRTRLLSRAPSPFQLDATTPLTPKQVKLLIFGTPDNKTTFEDYQRDLWNTRFIAMGITI